MLQKFNPQNENIFVFVKDNLYPRNEAKVSVFDSSVQGGDAVWEGLRVYERKIMSLNEHLDRLEASAHALQFDNVPSREYIIDAIKQTLAANKMDNNVHIRLTLTRGEKITSGMDPRLNTNGCCLIVLAEWKPPVYDNETGVSLVTAHIRRNGPQFLDSKIHHNNLLNNILAKIQANLMNADDALNMALDSVDKALMLNVDKIWILHGKGDGILRKIIRQNLKQIKHVKSIESEHADFGGDGITIIELM